MHFVPYIVAVRMSVNMLCLSTIVGSGSSFRITNVRDDCITLVSC
ncbi:hypothetical protein MLPF_1872 [Mycobacterium lepromatosis]|nr:hypothetical protein MLPF_1872 [Mycobacterium lepromatosis]